MNSNKKVLMSKSKLELIDKALLKNVTGAGDCTECECVPEECSPAGCECTTGNFST